ncbi:hypothetical protein HYU94_00485 [Candidatus Daviesbacteria bacterium]|nr:hypothetical protein [Candidatus Daviesbacteria bacterium]
MKKAKNILSNNIWIWILILSIPAVWALLVPGYYGASDDLHIAWLYQFHKTLFLGQIPPRFVPDLSFGFGYPLFNFVFPLPFYIGEIFHLLGLSFVDSIKGVFLISVPLSGIAMYLLLRQFLERNLSLIGAILYIYTPYRAVDLYIRGAIGEIVSFVFLPLIVLSVIKISEQKSFKWVGIGALSLASLVLSHNIAAYMFFPFAGLLFIIYLLQTFAKKVYLAKSFLMIFLGLLISVYFWLPALIESKLVKYDTVFNFADHFPTLRQLIKPYWGYGGSVPGPGDGMSFFLGGANIFLLVLGIILLLLKWKQIEVKKKILLGWVLSAIFIAIFLMNHRSVILWSNLPFLPYFQFPWRFLILTTFFIPLLLITFGKIKLNNYQLIVLLTSIILPTVPYFRPQDFLGRVDNYYFNRYIPAPVASYEYLQIQEEYLRLPKSTQKRPDKNYPIVYSDLGVIKNIDKINDLKIKTNVVSKDGMVLNLSKYLFPGWTASLNGMRVPIESGSPFGQVSVKVPPGEHQMEFAFTETGFKKVLDAISLAAFLVSLLMVKNLWFILRKIGRSF